MAMVDEGAMHPRGEALLQELLWVHARIRNNLKTIKAMIEQITNGVPSAIANGIIGNVVFYVACDDHYIFGM